MKNAMRVAVVAGCLLIGLVTAAYANVDLNYFIGSWVGDEVHLEWQTASETDSAGFFIWRSTEDLPIVNGRIDTSSPAVERLNDAPIMNPNGPCGTTGHTYHYVDDTVDPNRSIYYYYVESIGCASGSSFDGDGSNTGLDVARHRMLLPYISKAGE